MGKKIVCIDIGPVTTYVAETDYKAKAVKIYQAFQIPTPDGVVMDGNIQPNPDFALELKKTMAAHKIHTKTVLFVVNSVRIANRQVTIPALKENRIKDFLIANSSEYFPVDLSEYQMIHNVLEKDKKEMTLSVLAVPNDIIVSYQAMARAMGLQMVALDYMGNSIAQAMLRMHEDEVRVNLDIHEISSMLTIMQGTRVVMQRNINYGVQDAVRTVIDNGLFGKDLSYGAAMDIMRQRTLMFRRFNEVVTDDSESYDNVDREKLISLREEVTESLRMLVGNISRNLDYFASQNEELLITSIWVTGPGADVSGLTRLLTTELNLKCRVLQRVASVNVPKSVSDEKFRIGEYLYLVAAATNPPPISLGGKKGASAKEGGNDSLLVPGLFFGACALVAVALLVYFKGTVVGLEKEKQSLQTRINSLQDAKVVYENHQAVTNDYAQVKSLSMYTVTANDNALLFLKEMEEKMPSDALISNLTSSTQGINISVKVPSKAAASELLIQMRTFESIQNVTTTGLSDQRDENGVSTVTLSVTADYRTVLPEGVEETEGAEENPDGTADTEEGGSAE